MARDFPAVTPEFGDDLVVVGASEIEGTPPAGFEEMVFPKDSPAAGQGVRFRSDDAVWLALRRFYTPPVVLAGAGPGGVSTMTVGTCRALSKADVVLTDALCGTDVLECVADDAEVIPVGKRCGKHSAAQEDINRLLLENARRGRRVVRLKGGDPSVFGRLEEEIATLGGQSFSYRVLPGIGAASAAASIVGQPLTVREVASEIIFSTGRLAGGGKNPFPLNGPTAPAIALYMSRRVLAERMADLETAGYGENTPVAVVERIGSPEARAVVGTVGTIAAVADERKVGTPAVVLVGAQFTKPRHLPLAGVRIWLPGEAETAEGQREPLEELGATCVMRPLIEPEPYPVDEGGVFSRSFDWVVFTSKKGVDYLFELLGKWGLDSRWLPRVAAIGHSTIRKLRARGIEPDLMPSEHTRVALSESLIATGLDGRRVLIPASKVAPDHVREALAPHAAEVVRLDLYGLRFPRVETVPDVDVILFSSESTVRSAAENGLVDAIREMNPVIGGIGPATCGTLDRMGLTPAIVPDGVSPTSLAWATKRFFARLDPALREANAR
ncbi:MAG: uroporphyrinogen-III C-methyltransferase [Planctomycetota bacterium]